TAAAINFHEISANKLLPEKDGSGAFKVVEGKGKGQVYPFKREYKDKHWVINREKQHIGYYHIDSKGQIILDKEDDLDEGVQVVYTPGIVVLPGKITDKPPYPKGKVKMVVTNLKTG